MKDNTSHVNVRLGINPSYGKLCQCGIVSVNKFGLWQASVDALIYYLFRPRCSESRCPGLFNPNQHGVDFGGFYAVFMLPI
jgi:hypothetical protein